MLSRSCVGKPPMVFEGQQQVIQGLGHDGIVSKNLDPRSGMNVPKASFRDKLVGIINSATVFSEEELVSDDEDGDEVAEYPVIKLSKKEKLMLRRPWRQTLIVKILRRSVGYNYLLKRIKAIWMSKATIDMIAIEQAYYLVRFASMEDYNFAKFEGLRVVLDHYLIVNEWSPDFGPSLDNSLVVNFCNENY
ncbi:hypothetical protein PTKIN_Ptkin13bG0169900 [Pterospermum kingtungense]